jgi:hypothetical protein
MVTWYAKPMQTNAAIAPAEMMFITAEVWADALQR